MVKYLTNGDHFTASSPIGSFTVDVLKRILTVLSDQGRVKRTNLAGKTGLNYIVCLRYITFMKALGWLDVVTDENQTEYISITPVGIRVGEALVSFTQGRKPESIDYSDLVETRQKVPPTETENFELVEETQFAQEKESLGRSKGPKILLIDDEPDVALTYKSFLASEGYVVDAFRDPEKAVEHFVSSRPMHYDLVITDIRMPDMNGLRLYQCLKSIDPSIKVIFVTALDAANELASIVAPGPVRVLKKPVDKQLFSRSVKAALQAAN
jgi:CheY-like chemotaxis protein/predicted transcriptional regulator